MKEVMLCFMKYILSTVNWFRGYMNNPNTFHVNHPELITELDDLINESAVMEEIFKETESGSYMQKRYLN